MEEFKLLVAAFIAASICIIILWVLLLMLAGMLLRGSANTITSLGISFLMSLLFGSLIAKGLHVGMLHFIPAHALQNSVPDVIGLVAGTIAWLSLFNAGRFNIDPGETSYVELLGMVLRWIKYGRGKGALIPFFMKVIEDDSRAMPFDPPVQEYITASGLQVYVKLGGMYSTYDAFLAEGIVESSEDEFVNVTLQHETRVYLANDDGDIAKYFKDGKVKPEEAMNMIKAITLFKNKATIDGIQEIRKRALETTRKFGVDLPVVKMPSLRFDEEIESTMTGVIREGLEQLKLKQDAENSATIVESLMKVYEAAGVKWDELNNDVRADIVSAQLDRALAKEGQAEIKAYHFRGRPPEGTFVGLEGASR